MWLGERGQQPATITATADCCSQAVNSTVALEHWHNSPSGSLEDMYNMCKGETETSRACVIRDATSLIQPTVAV
jgi:hypothetical protein